MSRKSREERAEWLRQSRCFACGSPLDNTPSRFYCVRHWIRYSIRKRNLFYSKTAYKLPTNSRVRLERVQKRRFVVNFLRARFLSVAAGNSESFHNIREVLFFIDEMWSTLHLHHSFPLRTARLGGLIQFILKMDGLASGAHKRRRGWRGSQDNRHRGPRRKPNNGIRDGDPNKAVDSHHDSSQRNS